jgi:hypothetical protein
MSTKPNTPVSEIYPINKVATPEEKIVKLVSRRRPVSQPSSAGSPDNGDDPGPAAA